MKIGDYTIKRLKNGNFLIMHKDGEGMKIGRETLIKWLEKLWKKEF
jgi:hypothetical protein